LVRIPTTVLSVVERDRPCLAHPAHRPELAILFLDMPAHRPELAILELDMPTHRAELAILNLDMPAHRAELAILAQDSQLTAVSWLS
jgi:hypothetical protein